MAGQPNSTAVYNNANAMQLDSRTPGVNAFLVAWTALQDFTGNWAVRNYNQAVNVSSLLGGLST